MPTWRTGVRHGGDAVEPAAATGGWGAGGLLATRELVDRVDTRAGEEMRVKGKNIVDYTAVSGFNVMESVLN